MPPPVDPTKARVLREAKLGSPLVGCRFDPHGRFLFASAQDDTVRRVDLLTGKVATLAGHKSWVRGMAFLPRTTKLDAPAAVAGGTSAAVTPQPFTLIAGDYHGRLLWWDGAADAPTLTRTTAAHDGWVRAVAVSPDGRLVASCGNDGLVKLWSAADGAPVRTFAGHDRHVYNVAFHPGGKRLASSDLMGTVKDWDIETGKAVRDLDLKAFHKYDTTFEADIGGARGMAFDAAGTVLACAGITNVSNAFAGIGNPLVVLFDWADGKVKQLKPKDAFQGTAWGVAVHSAGFVVAGGGGSGGRLWFWNAADGANVHTVTVPTNARDMALSADGTLVAVAGSNGTAVVYTLAGK